jgi:alpha-L-fucosidase
MLAAVTVMRLNRRRALQALAGASAATLATQGVTAGQPLARPTPEQVAWQDMELEMFLCLDPCTWQEREYDDHSTPLSRIDPMKLDTDQWVDVAVSMGARQVLFVAKHTGGFCWWQTRTSNYGVKEIPWRSGKGDVVGDLSKSCRRRGIKLGIYLSPQDDAHGAGLGGKCRSAQAQSSYNAIYRQQLTELLSRYGRVSEVWFDGSSTIDVGDILKRHAPRAMVFQSPYATIRWVGNENGIAPYPAWNSVPEPAARSGIATAKDGDPEGGFWLPLECDARIRDTWFWNARNQNTLKSVDELLQMYYCSVGHGAVLLLNNTPDTTGLIPEPDVRRSAEFGAEVRRRFGRSLAETKGQGTHFELVFPEPTVIDHVIAMEDIVGGERVRRYRVEALVGKGWREICRGTSIGHKKIDPFPPVTASRVRLQVEQSSAEPLIRRFAAFRTAAAFAVLRP